MANGVSPDDLMHDLGSNSFVSTQRNAAGGNSTNTNPRRAYNQQAAAELTTEAMRRLSEQLETVLPSLGQLSNHELGKLYWPNAENRRIEGPWFT